MNSQFVILDTNHLRELVHETEVGQRLADRLKDADIFTTVVTAHEMFQGWSARINQHLAGPEQVPAYSHFLTAWKAIGKFELLPFDDDAALIFQGLRSAFRRTGTMDLKIAAICLAHDGLLLTRNLADFRLITSLCVENWLD